MKLIDTFNKYTRTPLFFLIFAAISAIINLYSFKLFVLFGAITILLSMKKSVSIPLLTIFILWSFFIPKTAFVIEIRDSFGKDYIYTTKGSFKNDHNLKPGDIIYGDFTRSVIKTDRLPYIKYSFPDNFSQYRLFLVSYLLEYRIKKSAQLHYSSGGKVTTTPAHLFAVRKYITDDLYDKYIVTGLAHLLAMSGFHVGIMLGGIYFILFFIPFKIRFIPILLILPFLIPLSGFTVTVIRAVIFSLAFMGALFFDIKIKNAPFIAALAGIFILFSPKSLFSVSFLLSFYAVFGIMLLFKSTKSWLKRVIFAGIGATILTTPIQLYFFGNTNYITILTTAIVTPFIYLQMNVGIIAAFFPKLFIPILALIEQITNTIMTICYKLSYPFFIVSKPPTEIILITMLVGTILMLTKYRMLSLLLLILPLLPLHEKNRIVFPDLPPSQKGYIMVKDGVSEIFYQGNRSTFVNTMVPLAATFGKKRFDYGNIRIFDGENSYIKIDNTTLSGEICVNSDNSSCKIIYYTRSDSIKSKNYLENAEYVIYKNKLKKPNINELATLKSLTYNIDNRSNYVKSNR